MRLMDVTDEQSASYGTYRSRTVCCELARPTCSVIYA